MHALAEIPSAQAESAYVVDSHVERGSGHLEALPITVATLRAEDGTTTTMRIVGGALPGGRHAHIAGYVVPIAGMTVRRDLRSIPGPIHAPPSRAWAQDPSHAIWTTLPVAFAIAAPGSKTLGVQPAADLAVAAASWARPSCSGFRATATTTAVNGTPGDDGQNLVFFEDVTWPPELLANALGQTVIHQNPDGSMHDADIFLNGAGSTFSLQGEGGTIDVRSLLTHEMGHALGLAHSADPTATMYPTLSGRAWRSLEADDRTGVCTLYPGKGNGGCDDVPCPADFTCVAAACERATEPANVCSPCARVADACEGAGADARCIDLPGESGRVCGRACDADRPCGKGFTCKATTASGDFQCVADDLCRSATNGCTTDADCTHSEIASTCVAGACAGPGDADGGEISGDAGVPNEDADASNSIKSGGGGCSSAGSSPLPQWLPLLLAAGVAGLRQRRKSARR